MTFRVHVFFRKWHRWGALLSALPFLVVLGTGLLLQLKKDWSWVQPPSQRGKSKVPTISMDAILRTVRGVPEAEVADWSDIDRLDVRPARGLVKVRCKNRYEVQVDTQTGELLQVAYRRSDLIEELHDGSWFHERAKLWIFLPTAVVVLSLWFTGIYLFVLPWWVRWGRWWNRTKK